MVARAKLKGAEAMRKKFRAMPRELQQQVDKALDTSADEIARTARHYAPRDTGKGSGEIGWRNGEHDLQRVVYAADDDTFYMRFQEHGTEDQPAQPFFWPAYRLHKKRVGRRIRSAIGKVLRKDAGL
ncbi:HK97 family phage protein [Stappia sp. 22II-S9-Z10]|nr:HK97 family phage protein [Stappia sp. 22II-S9-Z10]